MERPSLEQDFYTSGWVAEKCLASMTYSQNLYAALSNNEFQKHEFWPVLADQTWSCTWRYAGGIVADLRKEGDYLSWYCSGIGEGLGNGDADGTRGYVPEGVITDEIREDLARLGWIPVNEGMD